MGGGFGAITGGGMLEAAGAGAGGGFLSGLSNLFSNKLFQQYLAGISADLLGNTPGKNMNAITQQSIASQNMMKVLSQMLAGNIPDGGSVTHKAGETTLKVPRLESTEQSGSSGPYKGGAGMGPELAPAQNTTQSSVSSPPPAGSPMINPFGLSLPSVSGSDLAGLSPELISNALQLKQAQEGLGIKRISEAADILYKQGLLDYYRNQADIGREGLENERGRLRVDQFNSVMNAIKLMSPAELTEKQKDFVFAQSLEGGKYDGSFYEFIHDSSTTDWKNYQLAGGKEGTGQSYNDWLKTQNASKATRISLGEKLEEKAAFSNLAGELAGQEYFAQVDWPSKLEKEVMANEDIASAQRRYRDEPEKFNELFNMSMIEKIKSRVTSGHGQITGYSVGMSGITWTVKWPTGKETNIVYKPR